MRVEEDRRYPPQESDGSLFVFVRFADECRHVDAFASVSSAQIRIECFEYIYIFSSIYIAHYEPVSEWQSFGPRLMPTNCIQFAPEVDERVQTKQTLVVANVPSLTTRCAMREKKHRRKNIKLYFRLWIVFGNENGNERENSNNNNNQICKLNSHA